VLVPVAVVRGVPVTIVHVVDVVTVLDALVPAIPVVLAVVRALVHEVLTTGLALVPVSVVLTMDVPVVEVVDVVAVADLDVPTAGTVPVIVLLVGVVLRGRHALLLAVLSRIYPMPQPGHRTRHRPCSPLRPLPPPPSPKNARVP
jgi:hypothetical protein